MSACIENEVIVSFAGESMKINGRKEAKGIKTKLKENPKMTTFNLSGNTLGIDGAAAIGANLTVHKDLKTCLFSDMFTGRTVDEIAPALRHLSVGILQSGAQLTELDLSDNAFGPRGVVGVTTLLSSPACFSLKVLKMNNQGLGHQGARYLAEALEKGIKDSQGKGLKLEVFSAGRNRLENVGALLLAKVFSQMGSLKTLSLYQNGIGIHGPEGIEALAQSFAKNFGMRVLNLSDNTLTASGAKEIAKVLKSISNLEELILDDCLIRSEGCRALARELGREEVLPKLVVLRLYGNEIRTKAGVCLALALSTKASTLQHVSLDANEFGSMGIETLINTFDSVDLLPAIAIERNEEDEDDETEGVDAWHRAFAEDQGEDDVDDDDDDDDEDGGDGDHSYERNDDEEEYDDEEESYDNEDEYYEEGEYEDDAECSSLQENQNINGKPPSNIKERPVRPIQSSGDASASQTSIGTAGGFSFRSSLLEIQKNDYSFTRQQLPTKTNLFSGLDSTDASACRSKLWGSPGQVASTLFSPPRLNTSVNNKSPLVGLFSSPLGLADANFSESAAMEAMMNSCAAPEDDQLLKALFDKLPVKSPWNVTPQKLASLSATPESIVRVAFRMVRYQQKRVPMESTQDLSERLLLFACTMTSSCDTVFVSPSSRAVNRVLLHLGAIKPDRGDSLESKVASESEPFIQQDVNLLDGLLKHRGKQLPPDVRQTLSLLLKQHKTEHPNVPLDDLLNRLNNLSMA